MCNLKKNYTSLLQERPTKETIFGKCPQPSTRHLVDTLVSTEEDIKITRYQHVSWLSTYVQSDLPEKCEDIGKDSCIYEYENM